MVISGVIVLCLHTGAMFSLASSVESMGHLTGPLIFNLMYGLTTHLYRGFIFLVMASMYAPIFLVTE